MRDGHNGPSACLVAASAAVDDSASPDELRRRVPRIMEPASWERHNFEHQTLGFARENWPLSQCAMSPVPDQPAIPLEISPLPTPAGTLIIDIGSGRAAWRPG